MKKHARCGLVSLLLMAALVLAVLPSSAPGAGESWSLINNQWGEGSKAIHSSAELGGKLFVGVESNMSGAQVWSFDGSSWTWLNEPGFGGPGTRDERQSLPLAMAVYDNSLYVAACGGPSWEEGAEYPGCQVWRYDGGTSWTQVNVNGFGDNHNLQIHSMCVFQSKLYAGVFYHVGKPEDPANQYELMRYEGGTNWTSVTKSGVGMEVAYINSMAVYENKLFAAVSKFMSGVLVKCYDGKRWQDVSTVGFGDRWTTSGPSMVVYDSGSGPRLYVGTGTELLGQPEEEEEGCRVFRYEGVGDWAQVSEKGFGTEENKSATSMTVQGSRLYVGTWNQVDGCEVWAYNGTTWSQVNSGGFGAPLQNSVVGSLAEYNSDLYACAYQNIQPSSSGETGDRGGQGGACQVWRMAAPPAPKRVCATGSIGVPEPLKTWYIAEGATAGGFETWILVQNPGEEAARVTLTYQTDQGEKAGPTLDLPPKSRESVNVADTVQTFKVSTKVSSDRPVCAERALYYSR